MSESSPRLAWMGKVRFRLRDNRLREVLRGAARSFLAARGFYAAATISFYAIFSLFPLLILLVSLVSAVLQDELLQQRIVELAATNLFLSPQFMDKNIQRILELRGPIGIGSILALLWSATSGFSSLVYNINLAWPTARPHNLIIARLMAGGIVIGLLVLSVSLSVLRGIVHSLPLSLIEQVFAYYGGAWNVFLHVVPALLTFFMFWGLYRWVPNTDVKWRHAFGGALVTAIAWELAKYGFTHFFGTAVERYELVYGSLNTIVALMVWIYVGNIVALFGAHLSAAMARTSPEQDEGAEKRNGDKPNV